MLNEIKNNILLIVVVLFLLVASCSLVGIYKVYKKLQEAENFRIDAVKEQSFQEVNAALDSAVKRIDERTDKTVASLKEVLDDARADSSKPIPTTTIVQLKGPVAESAKPQTPQPSGPSATTVRAVDLVWDHYCTTFPDEPDCAGHPSGQKSLRTSAPAQ